MGSLAAHVSHLVDNGKKQLTKLTHGISHSPHSHSSTPNPNPKALTGVPPVSGPPPDRQPHEVENLNSVRLEGMKTTLRLIERSSDVLPPLKSVAASVLGVIDLVQQPAQNRADKVELEKKLETITSIIEAHRESWKSPPEHVTRRLEGLSAAIKYQTATIQRQNDHNWTRRTAEGTKNAGLIASFYRTVSFLLDTFQVDTALASEQAIQKILKQNVLDKLPRASHAIYNAASPTRRHGCTENTREAILAELMSWAADPLNTRIFWLNGMIGTGKTTIAYTFCEILDNNRMLGATFFCSRLQHETRDVRRIIPTIAYCLARAIPAMSHSLVDVLERTPDIGQLDLSQQFCDLILNPINTTGVKAAINRHYVIILEGLDECADEHEVKKLLFIISQQSSKLPLKFFITSRPEQPMRDTFRQPNFQSHSRFQLHDVEKDVVASDIELYLKERLGGLADERSEFEDSHSEWPSDDEIKILVERAGMLFIYAATVCDYIAGGGSARKRLMEVTSSSTAAMEGKFAMLDALYENILERAYSPLDTEEKADLTQVLQTLACGYRPLTRNGLSELLGVAQVRVHTALRPLHSVVYMKAPPNPNTPVSTLHGSFPDFLTDQHRSQSRFLNPKDSHRFLGLQCLKLLQRLEENICHLDGSRKRADISESVILQHISEATTYACAYWAIHLSQTDIRDFPVDVVHQFFEKNVLHWIECISILGYLEFGIISLRRLEAWAKPFRSLQVIILDTWKLLSENTALLKDNCLEIYNSALVWLPQLSWIRKHHTNNRTCYWKVTVGLPQKWDACEAVLHGHSEYVTAIAFTGDGNRIVSASNDNKLSIWNALTGKIEVVLEGHSDNVNAVAVSPDGNWIVSASEDHSLRIWNALTGEHFAALHGHTGGVTSVVFSLDGSRIVSASRDGTIRIWNTIQGQTEMLLKGHSDEVNSVAFSPDGDRIVSASQDNTLRVWNAGNGACELELVGHSHHVNSAIFSPDGSQIVSASSDKTLRTWNVITGECNAKLRGHLDGVNSVVCSPDGSCVVSASRDNTLRIWNIATGEKEVDLHGHSHRVNTCVFSPDGSQIVSASCDNTLHIWNAMTGECEAKLHGHSDDVTCVVYSPDGSRIVSASRDNTLRIWNSLAGESEADPRKNSEEIFSVAYPPREDRLASSLAQGVIHAHDLNAEDARAELQSRSSMGTPSGSALDQVVLPDESAGNLRIYQSPNHSISIQPPSTLDGQLSIEGEWVIHNASHSRCWIPSRYHGYSAVNFIDSKVTLGYKSGLVVILEFLRDLVPGY